MASSGERFLLYIAIAFGCNFRSCFCVVGSGVASVLPDFCDFAMAVFEFHFSR